MTGWSYTKVNRLLTEGRQAFLRRVSGIERGAECARYEPLLSALADGEASAEQLAILRPHMRTCLSCRARLREFRATPERVAALVPPAALVVRRRRATAHLVESMVGLGDRGWATAAELATGQKIAAVAASAAALAGGGTAIDEFANHQGPPLPEPGAAGGGSAGQGGNRGGAHASPAAEAPPADAAPAPSRPPTRTRAGTTATGSRQRVRTWAGAAPAASEPSAPASAPAQPAGGEFTSSAGGGGGGSGEFAP